MRPSFFLISALYMGLAPACRHGGSGPSPEPAFSLIENVIRRTVIIHYDISAYAKGTGVLINENGMVLTCFHVVSGWQDRVRVSADGRTFHHAQLLYSEPRLDLVLYQTTYRAPVSELEWANREDLHVNEPVFSVSAAWGFPSSFLKGYIVHTNRTSADLTYPDIPFIQTMGTSYPGASGAGVFLYDGRIIGINRATVGMEAGNSTGLVIPAGFVRTFLTLAESKNRK